MYKILTPFKIGKVNIKNRIIIPSMCLYFSDNEGNITDKLFQFFENRAKTGIGAFIIGSNPHGKDKVSRPSLRDDSKIHNWDKIVAMFKSYGSALFIQLHPSGIQLGRKEFKESPLDMTTEQVEELIEMYALGAERAKKAGVDGIEIHGAHGHEVALFLSQALNKRSDKYGDGLEGHAAIITEMIAKIKEKCGEDFPVILRISGEERIPGGRELPETIEICKLAKKAGADAIHLSVSMPDSEEWECAPSEISQGHLSWMGKEVKKQVGLPVIVVGRVVDWDVAEKIIEEEEGDFIAVGRAVLAEADWMSSIGVKNKNAIRRCIGCNQGCRTRREVQKTFTTCFQNPFLGHEEELEIKKDKEIKKVCIIGAGISGLEAANVMSLRGHDVTVFEKSSRIGGLFNEASLTPGKSEYMNLIHYYDYTLKKSGVKFILNHNIKDDISGFDIIIVAVGGIQLKPDIFDPGTKVIGALDLLDNNNPESGEYVMVGNGVVGYETADFLVSKGMNVTIIGESVADENETIGIARWRFMLNRYNKSTVNIIKGGIVKTASNKGFVYTDLNGNEVKIDGEYIFVTACGYKPDFSLYTSLKEKNKNVYIAGTAREIFDGMSALHDGFYTAYNIKI